MTPKSRYVWMALALALYLFFSLTYLELPGLYYDETNFITASLGHESGPFITWTAKIFGKKVPLMIMSYIGALKSGLYAPIFNIFGCSAITARLPVIFIGLITLLMAHALFRRMFDRTIANATLLLFATDATFLFSNRLDWGPVSLMLALEVSSLYFLWRWMTEDKNKFLAVAGFLCGLGLYNKIIFIWFLAAFFIGLLLCYRSHLKNFLHWRRLAWFVPAFVLGCLPLIAYNIDKPLDTFRGRSAITLPGLDTLQQRYIVFRGTMESSGVYHLVNKEDVGDPSKILKAPPAGTLDRALSAIAGVPWIGRSPLPFAFIGSLVLMLILMGGMNVKGKREILFLASQIPTIAILMCLNKEATGGHHAIAIYPCLFILIAWAVCEFARWAGPTRIAQWTITGACLLPLVAANVVLDSRYLKSFQVKGGAGLWSDAIYDLADFTRANPNRNFYLMEWGFGTQLMLLTNGSIHFNELDCSKQDLAACMESVLTRTNDYLVFHIPPVEGKPLLAAFKQALEKHTLRARSVKTFYQRDGQPVYAVLQIVHPQIEAFAKNGTFYYRREGEDFDAKSGGDLDPKKAASGERALGMHWGRRLEDFAAYRFTLPENLNDAHLYLRYAFEGPSAHEYYLLLDGNFVDAFRLPATAGFGYEADQWKTFEIRLGAMEKGFHELKLKPGREHQLLNLDYWYLHEGRRDRERLKAGL